MKHLLNCLSLLLLGSAVVVAGCSTSANTATDGSASGAGGSAVTEKGVLLVPDATGFVDKGGTATTMIQGAWYSYGDLADCTAAGHPATACSVINAPLLGSFPQSVPGSMCTNGTAAVVPTAADYPAVWGAGIALDLNSPGGDASAVKVPYNANANGVLGFSFDIDTAPPTTGMRVEFPTPATASASAYWNGGDPTAGNSPVKKGHNVILWAKVGGPSYATNPPLFDPTMINSIQFHIPTNITSTVPFSYCISNLKALTN